MSNSTCLSIAFYQVNPHNMSMWNDDGIESQVNVIMVIVYSECCFFEWY